MKVDNNIKESLEKTISSVQITDLYLNFSCYDDELDMMIYDESDIPKVEFFLSTSKEMGSCTIFLIVFSNHKEPILANIEVLYYGKESFGKNCGDKFKMIDKSEPQIMLTVTGTDAEHGEVYNEIAQDIKYIIPISYLRVESCLKNQKLLKLEI